MKKICLVLLSTVFAIAGIAQEIETPSTANSKNNVVQNSQLCSKGQSEFKAKCNNTANQNETRKKSVEKLNSEVKHDKELKAKIAKIYSKIQNIKEKAADAEKAEKSDLAKTYSDLAAANSKLAKGLTKINNSRQQFLSDQLRVRDEGSAFKGKVVGTAAMYPQEKISMSDRIATLEKCIKMYDKEGGKTQYYGSNTKSHDYTALGTDVKNMIDGLKTVVAANKELKEAKAKLQSMNVNFKK